MSRYKVVDCGLISRAKYNKKKLIIFTTLTNLIESNLKPLILTRELHNINKQKLKQF